MIKKKITVLLTTFNDINLENSLKSLEGQTFKDFQILLINDGGIDVIKLLDKSINLDIKYYNLKKNQGLSKCLNYGIKLIDTEYIARMDSDDYALPERLELQLKYIENNGHDLIGCSLIKVFKEKNYSMEFGHIIGDEKNIKNKTKFNVPLAHPTFFGKSELFKNVLYNENLIYSQDYDFIARSLHYGYKLGNLDIPLLIYNCSNTPHKRKVLTQMHISNLVSEQYRKTIKNKNYKYQEIGKLNINMNIIEKSLLSLREFSLNRNYKIIKYLFFSIYCFFSFFSKIQITFNLRNFLAKIL